MSGRRLVWAWLALSLVGAAGCTHRAGPPPGRDYERGIASWYGPGFHGRQTASGEIYDMEGMTAAHRTLPFGTMVEVQSLSSGKRARVRINDRGPFVRGRIIDLSRAAARQLGMIRSGLDEVVLRLQESTTTTGARAVNRYAVQLGAFATRTHAERLREALAARQHPSRVVAAEGLWKVRVGAALSADQAGELALALGDQGFTPLIVVE